MARNITIAGVVIDLIAESAQYLAELQKTNRETKKWARNVSNTFSGATKALAATAAGYLTISAAVAQVNRTIEKSRDIENLSRMARMSVEDFQAAEYAIKSYGVTAEQLADMSKDVADKLGDFIATGGGGFADFFENVAPQVGLTAEALKGLSGPDVLQAVKNAMDDANISMEEQVFYLESIANDASKLMPLLENSGIRMKTLVDKYKDMGVAMSELDIQNVRDMEASLKAAKEEAGKLANALVVGVADALGSIARVSAQLMAEFRKDYESAPVKRLQQQIQGLNSEIKKEQETLDNYFATVARGAEAGASANDKMGAAMAQANIPAQTQKVEDLYQRLEKLKKELELLTGKKSIDLTLNITKGNDRNDEVTNQKNKYREMSQQTKLFIDDVKDQFGQVEKASIGWTQRFSDDLTNMVMTGKMDFSSLAESIVADLIRIMIQAMITEPILDAVTSASNSWFGGGSAGGETSGAAVSGAKATGGPVMRGSTYLVGEKGPELFTASNSGSIVPNNQLGGGGTVVNIYNEAGADVQTNTRQTPQGDVIEIMLKQVEGRMNEQINRGQGLAQTLEGRYSLTRNSF